MKNFKDLGFEEDKDDFSSLGFQEESAPTSSKEAPGYLESFGRGAAQGVGFGFADEATAGIESLLTDKKYEDALAESRANYKAAEEANPKMTLAGNLTGGIAGGAALSAVAAPVAGAVGLGKAAGAISTLDKLKKATALGAGYGALTSAGTSEEPIMTRPVDLAKDVATGAAMGGAGGAVFSKAGDLVGAAANKAREVGAIDDMFRSFNVGKRGYNYFKPADMDKLEGEATQAAAATRDTIQEKLNNFASAKKQILTQAENEGKTIDILPLFNKAKAEIDGLSLDEIGAADKRKLQSVLDGLPQQLNYNSVSPSQADRIKQVFSNYTSFGDESLKTKEAKKIALDMVKSLDAQVLNSVDDITTTSAIAGMKQELGNEVTDYLARAQAPGQSSVKTVNKGLSDLMTTQELLGQDSGNAADRIKQIQKLRTMIGRTASEGDGGITARETVKETKKVLQNIAPEIAEETFNKAESLADDIYLKKLAKGQIQSGVGSLWGIGNIASVGGSNIAGSVYGAAKGLATPDSTGFRMMAKQAARGGDNALSSALDKIANTTDDTRRKAMVNTLMQTPYYRQKIEQIQTKLEGMMGDDDGSEN